MNNLDKWYKQIENYKRLKINEAQRLNRLVLCEEDENKKRELLNELFNGTLYVVLDNIKNNDFYLAYKNNYYVDDLVNSFNEEWYKLIIDNQLLHVNYYSRLFDKEFYFNVYSHLINYNYPIAYNIFLDHTTFNNVFNDYLKLKNNNIEVTYDEFMDILFKYGYRDSNNKTYANTYKLFENMYENMNLHNVEDVQLLKNRIDTIKYLLIDNSLETYLDDNYISTVEEDMFSNIYYQDLKEILDSINLPDRERFVVNRRLGLVNKEIYFEDIAKELNIATSTAKAIYLSGLNKIKVYLNRNENKGRLTL